MYSKKLIIIPILFSIYTNISLATVYENAEDGTTSNWKIHDNVPSGATINNIYDQSKNSNVIELKGEGRRNAYSIGERKPAKGWNNQKEQVLEWKMNFSEKFKITVYTQTTKGLRVFHYTHKDYNKGLKQKRYIKIGLGKKSMSGTWQSISRNLADDLKTYEPSNQLLTVNGIKIQGSGKLDDIQLVSKNQEEPALIRTAKEHCLNIDNTTSKVLCSNEENIVYILTEKQDAEQTTHYGSYQVSINPDNESINILKERTAQVWEHPKKTERFIKKLENTLIYGTMTVSAEADPRGGFTFFYKKNSVLNFSFVEDQGFLKNIHTLENGRKLSVEYTHTWADDGHYKEIYDISNPEEPKLISKIKIPLNEQF